ncbi:MAG TPA: serine/threonine-protein kinase [Ktedonobacteraceae bacterium]
MINRIGQQFGNYRLTRLLGQGGFAEVYLGEHILMQSPAAIKILYASLIPTDMQTFLQEARTLVALDHPRIVRVKDCGIERGIPFLVMDYAPNGTLRQRYPKNTRASLADVVNYVSQVAPALQYAHDRRLIHRDVKPENMLVGRSGEVLLSDFGIAVISATSAARQTKTSAGTAIYMAPEQILGKPYPASDQYALGIVVYEWLCGDVPFHGSFPEITAQHLHAPPPPFSEKGLSIPPAMEAVVMKSLAKKPEERFASVQEFALALWQSNPQQPTNRRAIDNSSDQSIFMSPPNKPSQYTVNPVSAQPLAAPPANTPPTPSRITPRLTPYTRPPAQQPVSTPIPDVLPSTMPGGNYHPTAPAQNTVYPRRRSHTGCVVTSVIGVIILIALVVSLVIFVPRIISLVQGFGSTPGTSSTTGNGSTGQGNSAATTGTNLPPVANTPEQLIDDFCQNLMFQNYQSAYEEYSKHLQAQVSFTDFVNYWSANNKTYYHIDRCDHQKISTPSGSSVTAPWSTHEFFSSQVTGYSVTFVIQGNEWKIDQIAST